MRHGRACARRRAGAIARALALAGTLITATAGCGITHVQDLNFRVDDRLHFVSPKDRSEVHQPVTVQWRMRDFTVVAPHAEPPSRDAGYFGVFVDRAPIHPGQTLTAVGAGDPVCANDPKCPDLDYLHQQLVFPTTRTRLKLPLIPNLSGKEKVQLHTITVVLLDTNGRRIGESAWELDLRIPKVGLS